MLWYSVGLSVWSTPAKSIQFLQKACTKRYLPGSNFAINEFQLRSILKFDAMNVECLINLLVDNIRVNWNAEVTEDWAIHWYTWWLHQFRIQSFRIRMNDSWLTSSSKWMGSIQVGKAYFWKKAFIEPPLHSINNHSNNNSNNITTTSCWLRAAVRKRRRNREMFTLYRIPVKRIYSIIQVPAEL